ncbi:MAG: ABC transporter permease [Ruminiclostridium sp.]|nr:ABC transporter permease [Ruminiclostridium sp.]
MSEFNVDDILAEFRDGSRKKPAPAESTPAPKTAKSIGATDIIKSIDAPKKEVPSATPVKETPTVPEKKIPAAPEKKTVTAPAEEYDDYKPTEPLFSIEQLRRIEAQRKEGFKAQSEAPAQKTPEVKAEKPAPVVEKPAVREAKPTVAEKPAVRKTDSAPARKPEPVAKKKPATIFGDIEEAEKKPKKEKAVVKINSNPFTSFTDTIKQNRFLFEELVKRDFKKKYKRTILGMLWSVISPFLTFLVQLFIFGYLFRRGDSNYVIYLLTGNLMFHFFSDTTNTGMFSLYSNAAVLSKINVSKSIFLLSSNVAGVFNFLLTLLVYFLFMIFTGVNFGPHLILMIYPIVCMTIFNIGISYILSALFVFFRDIQYLYSIATTLLMYLSAIFYYADSLPANIQFVFAFNPIYRYIAYMRQLVIDSIVPDLTSHLICLGFAVGALVIGYLFHKKTEKNFVYYY